MVAFASIQISYLAGGSDHTYTGLRQVVAQPFLLIPMLLYGLIAGPVAEDLGWRGFVLDALLSRWNPLLASAVLGAVWGILASTAVFHRGYTKASDRDRDACLLAVSANAPAPFRAHDVDIPAHWAQHPFSNLDAPGVLCYGESFLPALQRKRSLSTLC